MLLPPMGLSAFPCTYVRGAWDGAGQHLDNPQCLSGMGLQVVNPKKAARGPGSSPAGLEEAVGERCGSAPSCPRSSGHAELWLELFP